MLHEVLRSYHVLSDLEKKLLETIERLEIQEKEKKCHPNSAINRHEEMDHNIN